MIGHVEILLPDLKISMCYLIFFFFSLHDNPLFSNSTIDEISLIVRLDFFSFSWSHTEM